MSLEDPFFVVKDEVLKALTKTRGLYDRWKQADDGLDFRSAEEQEWAATELKNSLRSIEWDLEDLEDTVQIVEKNPTKFRIDGAELAVRKGFIETTREEVRMMKESILSQGTTGQNKGHQMTGSGGRLSPTQPASPSVVTRGGSNKYSRLSNVADSPHREHIVGMDRQSQILKNQDDTLDMMSESMGNIRSMSNHIAVELDEQAVMLDEFGSEMEHTESRMDHTLKKMAKVLHLSNDRRQWMAIGTISSAIFVVVLLLFII